MHKDKNGKIVASLTEVKNKTGDIFSLVDEFSEVILTSYNKPKYRISKIDISEILDLKEKESKSAPVEETIVEKEDVVEEAVVEETESTPEVEEPTNEIDLPKEVVIEEVAEESTDEDEDDLIVSEDLEPQESEAENKDQIDDLHQWDSSSKKELAFISEVKKPLQ